MGAAIHAVLSLLAYPEQGPSENNAGLVAKGSGWSGSWGWGREKRKRERKEIEPG